MIFGAYQLIREFGTDTTFFVAHVSCEDTLEPAKRHYMEIALVNSPLVQAQGENPKNYNVEHDLTLLETDV